MGGISGGGSSKSNSSSLPTDMTPDAFKNLQNPVADTIAQLLGYSVTPGYTTTTAGTAGTQGTAYGSNAGAAVGNSAAYGTQGTYAGYNVGSQSGGGGTTIGGTNSSTGGYGAAGTAGTAGTTTTVPSSYTSNGNGLLSGIPTYQGELTAPVTGAEQSWLDAINQYGASGGYNSSTAVKYLTDLVNGSSQNGNPFLDAAIQSAQRPTREALIEDLTRALPGRFTQAGQFTQPGSSSAFDRAAAIATRGAASALGDIATNMSYSNYNDTESRKLDAAKSLPGVQSTEVDSMIKSLQAEALPRLIQQEGIDKGIELFNTQVTNLLSVLGIGAGVTQPTIAQTSEESSSSKQKPGFSLAR